MNFHLYTCNFQVLHTFSLLFVKEDVWNEICGDIGLFHASIMLLIHRYLQLNFNSMTEYCSSESGNSIYKIKF